MNKFVVVNTDGKYVAPSSEQHELVLVDDINKAAIHDDDNIELYDGFRAMPVQVIMTIVPLVEDLPVVEHITARNKTIYGVIRKDITVEQARVLDPYTFPKDGGFFIRQKNDK